MSVPRWLVLGLGNPLAGADGFGPAVIERLSTAHDLPEHVELADAHTDLLGQIHRFSDYDGVVLVDAVLDAQGGVAIVEEETFARWADRSPGAHQLSPIMAVQLFRALQEDGASLSAPAIMLVAHRVRDEDFHLPPSDQEIEAGASAVRQIVHARRV